MHLLCSSVVTVVAIKCNCFIAIKLTNIKRNEANTISACSHASLQFFNTLSIYH